MLWVGAQVVAERVAELERRSGDVHDSLQARAQAADVRDAMISKKEQALSLKEKALEKREAEVSVAGGRRARYHLVLGVLVLYFRVSLLHIKEFVTGTMFGMCTV